jgi:hypothetical protein
MPASKKHTSRTRLRASQIAPLIIGNNTLIDTSVESVVALSCGTKLPAVVAPSCLPLWQHATFDIIVSFINKLFM